jgi:hypothetical protein
MKLTFIAVVTLDSSNISRLGTFLGNMTTLVTVAALGNTLVGAITAPMTGFTRRMLT